MVTTSKWTQKDIFHLFFPFPFRGERLYYYHCPETGRKLLFQVFSESNMHWVSCEVVSASSAFAFLKEHYEMPYLKRKKILHNRVNLCNSTWTLAVEPARSCNPCRQVEKTRLDISSKTSEDRHFSLHRTQRTAANLGNSE